MTPQPLSYFAPGGGGHVPLAARARPADGGRDVLVTRPGSTENGTARAVYRAWDQGAQRVVERIYDVPFFVDWLSVSQVWPDGGLPLVDAGTVMACDSDGVLEWSTCKSVQHQGSFETVVNVKCDGHRITFSGNVSRFGRRDNLFGFGFFECMSRVNDILLHYGLPPFSPGERTEYVKRGSVQSRWTGARVSRIDLTANFESGSADNGHAVLQFMGSQHAGRHEGRTLGQGETVAWGLGSRRQAWKCYIKHLELMRHDGADPEVVAHCRERGIVRFEGTVRSNALSDLGCAYLGDYTEGQAMGQLVHLFNTHAAVMDRAQRTTDDLDELPKRLRATARDYLAGMDVRARMGRNTFYTHRRELLAYGIDISMRNVQPFKPRTVVIQLAPAEVPSWYRLAA